MVPLRQEVTVPMIPVPQHWVFRANSQLKFTFVKRVSPFTHAHYFRKEFSQGVRPKSNHEPTQPSGRQAC